jgi:L-2-hydroxyglutarate oxidase LhgO
MEGLEAAHVPELRFAKGCYFTYGARTNFRHLIYPVPEPGGLGTHLTLDLAGQARFGPDVEWVDDLNYDVSESRRETFAAAVRQFWPGVDPDQLQPAYAGIRPKLSGPGEPNVDFLLSGPADHQLDGIINLFGIESPGLTSSLALAERVHAIWEASR